MNKQWNLSNVKINLLMTPLAIGVFSYFGKMHLHKTVGIGNYSLSSYLLLTTILYMWCSRFFQPDLDHDDNRPGKGSFPIGVTPIKGIRSLLRILIYPLFKKDASDYAYYLSFGPMIAMSTIWNYFWAPYAFVLTHRGLSHWPIIGTMTRIWYLQFFFSTVAVLLGTEFIELNKVFDGFSFWKQVNEYTYYVAIPIYTSDLFHSFGDLVESKIKGFSFCPPGIRRGPIAVVLRLPI